MRKQWHSNVGLRLLLSCAPAKSWCLAFGEGSDKHKKTVEIRQILAWRPRAGHYGVPVVSEPRKCAGMQVQRVCINDKFSPERNNHPKRVQVQASTKHGEQSHWSKTKSHKSQHCGLNGAAEISNGNTVRKWRRHSAAGPEQEVLSPWNSCN